MRNDAREAFKDYLSFERGLSSKTLASYGADLDALAQFLFPNAEGALSPSVWKAVSQRDLERFMAHELSAGMAEATRARRLVAIKRFFAWLREEDFIDIDPASSLVQARRSRTLPHALGEGPVRALLDSKFEDTPEGLRDRALLELLYGCGLRASEAAEMPLDAIRLSDALVRVLGKGSKERFVPLGAKAESALKDYLEHGRPLLKPKPGEPRLFLSATGRGLSRQGVWRIVKERAVAAGFPPDVSPHWLRHTFATHLLAHGAPERVIQEMLGHADIGTTQIYTHVDVARLAGVVRSFHPRGSSDAKIMDKSNALCDDSCPQGNTP